MLKKTIEYEDWNGKTRTEDFYFNLTRPEIAELEYGLGPGKSLTGSIQDLIDAKDFGAVLATTKELILKSYGVKSDDGRRFVKNQEIRDSFEQNPAYDILYMELATNAESLADFIAGLMPKSMLNSLGPNPKATILDKLNTTDLQLN